MIGVNHENEKPFNGTEKVVPLIQIIPLVIPTPTRGQHPPPLTSYPFFGPQDSPPHRRRRRSVKTKNHVKARTNSSHHQYKPMNLKVAS